MIWKPCTLYRWADGGTDELGNAVRSALEVVKKTRARHTPWTNEEIAILGEVTKNEQAFVLKTVEIPGCDIAEIDGTRYKVTRKIKLEPRYTVLHVKAYKEV